MSTKNTTQCDVIYDETKADKYSVQEYCAESQQSTRESTSLQDEAVLASCGYKQEFKREFNMFSSFAVSFSVLGLLPSMASTLVYGLGYAGTAGMTWGYLLSMIGVQSVAMGMAELASSMPTAAGLYYCSAMLAPPRYSAYAAYITGWSNWLTQVTAAPSVNYGNASMLLALVSLNRPSYVPQNSHVFALTIALMLFVHVLASLPSRMAANINMFGTVCNTIIIAVFLILVPVATTNRNPRFYSTSEVWGTVTNGTSWPDGVAVLMSFISIIYTMSGFDSPFQLSEECSNASVATPRAIFFTSTVGGTLGWFISLVIAYTIKDIPAAINSNIGQPYIAWLQQVLSNELATVIGSMTVVCGLFMAIACALPASRLTFAYSRDGVFPYSKVWAKVNKRTTTPVNAVWLNCTIGIACLCLLFAGDIAIGAIFSIGAIASYFAFCLPIALKCFVPGNNFQPGPWNLGRWSQLNGCIACAYTALMIPILLLPSVTGRDLNASTMNWTVVVWGGPLLLATSYFLLRGHKTFKGPVPTVRHTRLDTGQEVAIIKTGSGDDTTRVHVEHVITRD